MNSLTECRKTQSLHADVLSESDDLYARLAALADATGDPRLLRLAHDIAAITAELARRDDLGDVLASMPGPATGGRAAPGVHPLLDRFDWDDGHLADVLVLQPGEAGRSAPSTGSDAAVYAYA